MSACGGSCAGNSRTGGCRGLECTAVPVWSLVAVSSMRQQHWVGLACSSSRWCSGRHAVGCAVVVD